MRFTKPFVAFIAVAMAGMVHGNYIQGFETYEFKPGTTTYGYAGLTPWGSNPYWGLYQGGGCLVDTSLATGGYPAASTGNRYIVVNRGGNQVGAGTYDYNLFNLDATDVPLVTSTLQTVSFDFYVDNTSATDGNVIFYIRANEVQTPYYGDNYWGYLKTVQITKTGAVWKLKYESGGGSYSSGQVITARSWHHLEYRFNFSVQNGSKNGAKVDLVLDGTTLASNINVDYYGCNIDPAQLSIASPFNPFRIYWEAQPPVALFIDNFSYAPTQSNLTGSVTLANYTGGDRGIVVVKIKLLTPGTTSVVQTYKALLSDNGTFSIPQVPQGTYDIAIQGSNWPGTTVKSNVIILSNSMKDIGPVSLPYGGDCSGDNRITSSDLAILLDNMDLVGD